LASGHAGSRPESLRGPAGTFPVSITSYECRNPAHGGAVNEEKIKNAFNCLTAICLAATVSSPDHRPKWNLHTVLGSLADPAVTEAQYATER
jgi:hypothetical protein